jgi:cell division initiation protein
MGELARRLKEVDFSWEIRGYSRDEVDEFLDEMAERVEALESEVENLRRQAAQGEQRLPGAGEIDETKLTETMSKALLLAQKTADTLVLEARENANQIMEKAREEARRLEEATKKKLEDEVKRLTQLRASLQAELREFAETYVKEKEAIAASLSRLAEWVRSNLNLGAPVAPGPQLPVDRDEAPESSSSAGRSGEALGADS